jgi:hypothetical protein
MIDMWYGDVGVAFDILYGSNFTSIRFEIAEWCSVFIFFSDWSAVHEQPKWCYESHVTDQIVASRSLVAPMRRVNLIKFACEGRESVPVDNVKLEDLIRSCARALLVILTLTNKAKLHRLLFQCFASAPCPSFISRTRPKDKTISRL